MPRGKPQERPVVRLRPRGGEQRQLRKETRVKERKTGRMPAGPSGAPSYSQEPEMCLIDLTRTCCMLDMLLIELEPLCEPDMPL